MTDESPKSEPKSEPDKRTNLGRGLAALFGEESEDYASLDRVRTAKTVPIEHLHPNRLQPRRHFPEEALEALADSIAVNGILQPLLVRRHPQRPSEFEIVAGERRWRAAQIARIHEAPVVIRELTDAQALELSLVENVQREDLVPIEEARGYRRLIDEFGHTQEALSRAIGKSRSHIANTLRLLNLPEAVQEMLTEGRITAGHARALLGAEDGEFARTLGQRIVADGLSVRQVEALVQATRRPPHGLGAAGDRAKTPGRAAKDPDTLALERDLTALLGLKVTIELAGEGGWLTVHYRTLEQLDDVLHRLSQGAPSEPK